MLVGINEAANVPHHPEFRLVDIAKRARGRSNGRLRMTAASGLDYGGPWSGGPISYTEKAGHWLESDQLSTCRYAGDDQLGDFRKSFIDDISRFDIWRVMDLTNTNHPAHHDWQSRPVMGGAAGSWFIKGWPWEAIISAANLAGVNPWICLPHTVGEEYAAKLGSLFYEELRDDLNVYFELSNEHWNPRFPVYSYYGDSYNYGKRSAELFLAFEGTFGGGLFVLAGQAGSRPRILDALAGAEVAKVSPDVISCACYINPVRDGTPEEWATEADVNEDATGSLARRLSRFQDYVDVAKDNGAKFIAYEAGLHYAPITTTQRKSPEFCDLLHYAQRTPAVKPLYKKLRRTLREMGADGICYFQRLAPASLAQKKFGVWGHKDDSKDVHHPKWEAVLEHIEEEKAPPEVKPVEKIYTLVGPKCFPLEDRPVEVHLPQKLAGPFSVVFRFARLEAGGDGFEVGISEAVRFDGADGQRAHCDVGEPDRWAVRSRHLQDLPDGKVLFTQNGSSPAAAGIHWHLGYWHHAAMVFDGPELFAYLDDYPRSIQAPSPRAEVPTDFNRVTIGRCWRWGHPLIIADLEIWRGRFTEKQIRDRARRLGCHYVETEAELRAAGRKYISKDPIPTELIGAFNLYHDTATGDYVLKPQGASNVSEG